MCPHTVPPQGCGGRGRCRTPSSNMPTRIKALGTPTFLGCVPRGLAGHRRGLWFPYRPPSSHTWVSGHPPPQGTRPTAAGAPSAVRRPPRPAHDGRRRLGLTGGPCWCRLCGRGRAQTDSRSQLTCRTPPRGPDPCPAPAARQPLPDPTDTRSYFLCFGDMRP